MNTFYTKGDIAIWLLTYNLKINMVIIIIIAILINYTYYNNTDHVVFDYAYNFVLFIYDKLTTYQFIDRGETITIFVLAFNAAAITILVLYYAVSQYFKRTAIEYGD